MIVIGRLFIYSKKIFFHSAFNNILLFSETIIDIKINDISNITKDGDFIFIHTENEIY